jgi:hypothetical protein
MTNNTRREATLKKKYGKNWRNIFSEAAKKPRPNGGTGGFKYLKEHNPDKLRQIIEERDAKKEKAGGKIPTQSDQDISHA